MGESRIPFGLGLGLGLGHDREQSLQRYALPGSVILEFSKMLGGIRNLQSGFAFGYAVTGP